ncbi:MAG: DUF4115 domain-containing protein [Candidatus Omnitrophica bacterium]|nr:DUF4115 domain-containing protein [Candidatus Omnitrophota bacterium]
MSTIGQRLIEARKRNGWEIEDIYLKIKISSNVLIALEQDKAEEIVDDIYVRNFLKQYADFLGLDGEALRKEYIQSHSPKKSEPPLKVVIQNPKGKKFRIPRKLLLKTALGIMLITAVSGLIIFVKGRKETSPPPQRQASPDNLQPAIPSKKEKLNLTIVTSAKVWIEIRADGNTIMRNFLSKKSRETWQADNRFEITVGKPEAVELFLNQNKLTVPKHKRIKNTKIDLNGIHF